MRILSNFKDYYDFVAWQYDGGDPNCVYLRHRSSASIVFIDRHDCPATIRVDPIDPKNIRYYDWFFFCGDVYIIDEGKITERIDGQPCGKCIACRTSNNMQCLRGKVESVSKLKQISMKYNEPVFQFRNGLSAGEFWIPTLKDIGFDKLVSPGYAYHQIETYKRNVLTPVTEVSGTNQTDKEKTVSHGFDVKQSFRHRV